MASDDHSGGARPAGPVVLRIKLRYDDVDAMVQRFAPNVGKSGLFLPTKSIQPIGTEVKFELRLSNDTAALVGIGRVKHVKPPDPKNPRASFGMAIELMRVSREGREVIIRMIERRRAMGLPDVAIPLPEDVEAARRSDMDSQPRADTSGIVREAMAQFASAPVEEQVLSTPPPTGPVAVVKPAVVSAVPEPSSRMRTPSGPIPVARDDRSSAPLLTSPRGGSGPISRESSKSVPVLAPEAPRAKRPRVSDLIAKAAELSGPLAAVAIPGLDEHVDIDRALSRARSLAAGTDLDAELAAVRESAAAPVEISIDAASAELARHLGGNAIARRDRSARWVPPPPVETRPSTPADAPFVAKTRAETEAGAASVLAAVIDRAVEASSPPDEAPVHEPAHEEPPPHVVEQPVIAAAPPVAVEEEPVEQGDDDDAFAVNASTTTAIDPGLVPSSSFERAFSDAERLNTGDLQLIDEEELHESTQIGQMPVDPNAFQHHGYATLPDESSEQVADSLDRQLDEAEAEEEADLAQAMQSQPSYDPHAHAPYTQASDDDEDEGEEISDLDVLAIADEDDADLLGAHGEREASNSGAPAYRDPVEAPYQLGAYEPQEQYDERGYPRQGMQGAHGDDGQYEHGAGESYQDANERAQHAHAGYEQPAGHQQQAGYEAAADEQAAGYEQAANHAQPASYDEDGQHEQPAADYQQAGYQQAGYEPSTPYEQAANHAQPASYDEGGQHEQPAAGYQQAGYEQAGYEQAGYEQAGYEQAGYEPSTQAANHAQPASYDEGGQHEQPAAGYQQAGYQQAGYEPSTPYQQAANHAQPESYDEHEQPAAGYQQAGYEQAAPYEQAANHAQPAGYNAATGYEQAAHYQQAAHDEQAGDHAQPASYPRAESYEPPNHYAAPEHLDESDQERPSQSDFASRLDLGDEESAEHQPAPPARTRRPSYSDRRGMRPPSASEFPDPPSESYTFAEPFPQAALHLPDNDAGEEFDEPHSYARRQAAPTRAPEPTKPLQPVRTTPPPTAEPRIPRQNTDDLEDALAALDVDLDEISPLEQQRPRRASQPPQRPSSTGSSAPRPLPGLPIHRPTTGPVPTTKQNTGSSQTAKPVTGASPAVKGASPTVKPRGVAHTVPRAGSKPTMPPPVPAAALRKPPTQQAPIVSQPPKRATTDDGVLIDFDDDE